MRTTLVALCCAAVSLCFPSPVPAQAPTMDALWPNEDGHSWSYALHHEGLVVVDSQVRVFLDGTTVAPGGVGAQYLRQVQIAGPATRSALASLIPDPLLRRVWTARPDLRAKVLRAASESPCPQYAPAGNYALLLGGEFAYLKSGAEIAALRCDLAGTRSWLWLVSDLTLGSTFTLQLLPDFASNIFLHGTVSAIEAATVPAGSFEGCVRVDYVVDYGTSECLDAGGNVTGTSRYETRGFIRFAPNVGPVESSEEDVLAEVSGTCADAGGVGQPFSTTTLRLIQSPVPTKASSWGRIKVVYR